jgi:hypothetical protein
MGCSILRLQLPVHLYTDVRAYDTTEGALGAILFILIDAVMVSGPVEIFGHHEHPVGARLDAQFTTLTALLIYDHVVHSTLPLLP